MAKKDFQVGDIVLCRPGDDWMLGAVSRKSGRGRGATYDVRLSQSNRVITYLKPNQVKKFESSVKVSND